MRAQKITNLDHSLLTSLACISSQYEGLPPSPLTLQVVLLCINHRHHWFPIVHVQQSCQIGGISSRLIEYLKNAPSSICLKEVCKKGEAHFQKLTAYELAGSFTLLSCSPHLLFPPSHCFSPSLSPLLIALSPSVPQPLLSPQELEKTKAVVKEFGREGGAGEKLQQALLEKTKNSDSWVGGRE